ncbi:flagellar protein FlgN [Oscillospiraceae bacterium OttesenSCG-928-F05]|nr:flagellar protein FlgN [Oscillospiraceae bacterium OttesenSCG-928-F05]
MSMDKKTADAIFDVLGKKRALLQGILELTQKQARYIASLQSEQLLDGVTVRQQYVDQVNALDGELQALEAAGGGYPEGARALVEELISLLSAIEAQDRANEEMGNARIDQLKQDMRKLAADKKGAGAYGQKGYSNSAYFSTKH